MYELRTSSVVHLLTVFRPDRWFRRSAPRRKKASIPPVRVQPLVAQLNRVLLTSTQVVFVASVAVGDTNVVAVGFHPIDRIVYVRSHYLEMTSIKRFCTQVCVQIISNMFKQPLSRFCPDLPPPSFPVSKILATKNTI